MRPMVTVATFRSRALRGSLFLLLLSLLLVLHACEEDETVAGRTGTCPNDVPVDGTSCSASQHGFECNYVYVVCVDEEEEEPCEMHCEMHYRANCTGNADTPTWTVTGDCASGQGGAGGQGGGSGAGGSGGSSSTSSSGTGGGGHGGAGGSGGGGSGGGGSGGGGSGGGGGGMGGAGGTA